jgi:hypothetical protein
VPPPVLTALSAIAVRICWQNRPATAPQRST